MQKWDAIGRRGWGVSECSGRPIFILFLLKKIGFAPWPDIHAEPNINILLTKNCPFGYGVRQWSHSLMIPLHCLWDKSNTWSIWMWRDLVLFWFWFCSFTCTVRLLFHSLFTFSSCASKTDWLENEYQKYE